MKKHVLAALFLLVGWSCLQAQGPPITADKPIMLGGKSFTTKTLMEFRNTQRGDFAYIPLMLHYLPSSNSLVAVHIPLIDYRIDGGTSGTELSDIKILGKYQFYRKDATGKTFRMVLKTIQQLPTGPSLDMMDIATGEYQSYFGWIAGYETLQYGISSEIGYNWMPNGNLSAFQQKLGFGLPLLKPQYPNKQLNLYFEYANVWVFERSWYQLLYAQGIQYARKNITFDLAVQVPLVNDVAEGRKLNQSVFLGARYTF
jgi:hypothetical protein